VSGVEYTVVSEWSCTDPEALRPLLGDGLVDLALRSPLRLQRRIKVWRAMPGCWEAWCRICCPGEVRIVAQVGTWERAMRRAGEHVQEVHGV
jgi:hypothetical protein